MRVLLTNDDGIDSPGLHALARALGAVADVMVVAPAENQSAVARGITIRRALEVEEREVEGATAAYAVGGTPVDCVRFAEATEPGPSFDLVVAGANLGLNLGDDVTYSGTVAAAMEGVLLGTPGLAVSQQSTDGELHHTRDGAYEFGTAERLVPLLAERLARGELGRDVLLNVNCPTGAARGVRVCRLGRRIWADQIELAEEHDGRRRFRLYSGDADYHRTPGTDFEAIGDGCVAITALHVDWEHPQSETLLGGLAGLFDEV
ncbi:MAG: 5'/3'-nucleotidase SurE [Gaiellales bacterium]